MTEVGNVYGLSLYQLAKDEALAKKILAEFTPRFENKEAFLAYQDSLFQDGDRIVYGENGEVQIRINGEDK